uniref:Fanconi anemia group D2 protein n=1 Tax=Schistosoma mansoni TaxID=6183 RepID=A0A5K4ERV3_SCHMA
MLSRISDALGCCDKDSSSDYEPEGSSWLSTSVEVTPFFVVPAQTLQDILQKVGISRCPNTGQFYLTKIPFLAVSNHVSNPNSPWAMAYSAQKRCRYLETFLKSKHQLCHKLTGELRSLSAISDENISGNLSTFFSLLCPLLTDTPNAEFERSDNDVLMLFGSPATAFQILLYTPCLCSFLTDFVLELVANRSPYSEHLLEQFRQPIGLHALFGTKQTFSDISSRLTDLFQIAEEPRVQAKILGILPDLASSPCSSGCILTDEDRSSLVSQLINLLDNVSLENQHTSPKDCNAVICLIECLTNFSVKGNLTDRLHSAFFQLLDRCNGLDFYFEYLRIITRCLLISGPALPQTPTELSKLVTRLRTYFMFARSDFVDSAAVINSTLVDLLRVAFQFNKNIVSEWIRVIGLDSQTCDLTCQTTNDFRPHNQSFQDFIILCIALSTPTMTVHKSGDNLDVASDASMEALCSSDSYKYNRLKSEVLSSVRRLLITGRLFSLDRIHNDIDTFLANYGELLVSGSTRLFSPFTIILNQLITSNDLVPSRFKFVTRYIALSLYIKTFTSCMSDHLQKQEIVSHLVHHSLMGINNLIVKSTGRSKLEGIIDATLVTLIRLAQSSARELGVFETNLRALRNQVDFTGSCCDPKQTNSKDSNVVNGHHSGYLHQKKHIKHIFFILAYTAFGIREHHEQQDSLLLFVRKLLSSQSLFSKCVGIIGAVVIIEVICRRDSSLKNVERNPATCLSLNEDDSAVLASQLAHLDSGRSSTYTTNTSRSSNASSLSLKVPGTELADDPCDVHLSVVDSEEDTGANCSSHSSHLITPSRLLLRLIGLVEYSVRSYCQLMVFWLEELAFCFNRLTQLGDKSRTSQSVLDHGSINESPFYGEGKKLVIWMGARIMRHFQDDFVLDNASLQNHLPQFSLHKPSLCEVAVALGPSWDRCSANQRLLKGASLENSFTSSPLLLPAYLNLIAIVEADQNNGNLNTIDALLGCPVLMPNIFLNSKATQLIMANEPVSIEEPYLVIGTINWFIETVNVFASKLLLANSSSSQNFHSQTVASTDVSNSTRTHYLSILLRLIQIAKLRHCLYYYVVMALRMKDVQQPDAVEISDIENPGFQSHRMPTDSEYSVSSSNLFFPTATYQPAMCFSNHFASCNKEVNHVWFNCGVRLQSFLSGDIDCSSGRKRKGSSSRFGACSKGKETLVSSNVSMVKRRKVLDNTIESQWENVNENEDDNLSEMSDSAVSQDESNTIQQSDSPQTSRKHDKKTVFVKSSKMAKVSRKAIKSDKRCVMPSLRELTTCFRELDLNAIVLGLSSWPWVVKCSDDHVSNVSSIDWTTLTWLLDELSIRLDYVIGVPLPATDGWDAFGRLNNLTESSKLAYFTYIVPYLVYILVHAVDYIPGIANHANYSKNNVGNTVFSSDSSNDEGGSQDITESEKSQSDAPTSEKSNPLNGSKFIESLSSGLSCQISSIVCICLRSLLIFINGFINLSPNVGRYLFDSPDSLAISSMTTFTYNTINTFAKCCKSNINTSAAREIVINAEGIIRPDHYKPINHDYDVEQATLFMKQIDEVDGKLFVDIYDENYDSLPVLKEISNVPRIDNAALSENLRTIIEYLMKNLTPSRLPNANAALLHCRLVFYLSSLYYECQNSLSVSCQSDENTFWVIPDLFSYTKDVLNQEWEASIKLTDQTYSECLQALLSFHLRCQFYRSKKLCSLSQSTSLLVDFTRRALAPTVQYHQNTIHSLSSNGVSDNLNDSYRTLNQRTIDIFCREVLESVVWISKHLCDLARGIYTSVHLDESSIVAQWNQCVEVLCCITDFFRKSERITESNSKFSRNFPPDKSNSIIHLLPTVMRTGRLFLQLLLKGAMPLLNNLFRHRGVEVTTFLKNTQQLTRFLQRICNHAKTYRDSQLTNQIPATRRCLETFVYKVKVMLSQNRCLEAFWLGTLKNRDLHGTDLSEDNDSVESDTECLSTGSRSVSYSNSSRIDIDRNSATHCLSNTSTSTSNRIANEGQSIPGYTNGESEEVEEECEGSIEEEDVIDKSPSEDSDLIEANDDY